MTAQKNNPLHGQTLEKIITELYEHFGWGGLATRIKIKCFDKDPSVKSCLTFLRKTPWARTEVETLYVRTFAKALKAQKPL